MRLKYLAVIFPMTIIGLMTAERLATCMLGSYPAEPALWAISLELRSLFRDSASWLEAGTGGAIILQIGLLGAMSAGLLFAMGTRRWATFSFLVNHAALLFVGIAALFATGSTVASSSGSMLTKGNYLLASSMQLDTLPLCRPGAGSGRLRQLPLSLPGAKGGERSRGGDRAEGARLQPGGQARFSTK